MTESLRVAEVQMGQQGRVVIPAALRNAWQVSTGDTLLARLEEDRLILEEPAQVMQRVKIRFATLHGQPSLADELIGERHRKAAAKSGE